MQTAMPGIARKTGFPQRLLRSAPPGPGRAERRLRETEDGPGCLNNFAEFTKGPRRDGMTKANKAVV